MSSRKPQVSDWSQSWDALVIIAVLVDVVIGKVGVIVGQCP